MSRIAEVRVTPIALKDPPLLNASGVHEPFTLRSIIEIESADGHIGLGETYGEDSTLLRLQAVAPRLKGLDSHNLTGVWAQVRSQATADIAPGSKAARTADKVFAGFETALADLNAREAGIPLSEWLGGRVRDRVPYSAYLFYKFGRHFDVPYADDPWGEALDPAGIVMQARRMIALHGFGSIKLKAGVFEPDSEADALLALHAAFPDLPLRIDPNGNWRLETALKVAQKVGSALQYFEDPVLTLNEMAELHRRTGLMLATNMVVCDRQEFVQNQRLGFPIQTILCDHHFWPGFRATRELGAMCETFGLRLSMHSNSHAGVSLMAMSHLAATLPVLSYACDTHYPWQSEDVLAGGRVHFVDGCVPLSDKPGLGVELDRNALAMLHEQYLRCGYRERNDEREMQKHQPGYVKVKPRY
jgi:glucarate dehydratase